MKISDEDRALLLLTPEEFDAFAEWLNEPPKVLPRLAAFLRENRADSALGEITVKCTLCTSYVYFKFGADTATCPGRHVIDRKGELWK
jgi:hypothetical protein